MRPNIVYEDDNIIICNKRPGMASQSEKGFEVDLLSSVMTYRTQKKESAATHIINRLDKPVGGLVLFAKDKSTAAALSALSGEHSIEKMYYAVVEGTTEPKGELKDFLVKDAKNNVSRVCKEDEKDAKKALLSYETLETKEIEGKLYSLVRIKLYTGRHHQIRVQFSSRGHALYGDIKYNKNFCGKRGVVPALFAYSLSFNNPSGAERIRVEVKPEGKSWDFEYFK